MMLLDNIDSCFALQDFVSSPQALSGVKPANMLTLIFSFRDFPAYSDKITDIIIQNICSFIKRFYKSFLSSVKNSKVHIPKEVEIPAVL